MKPQAGKYHQLQVLRLTSIGAYLNDGDKGILLPQRYIHDELKVGDNVNVFVYHDSEDRLIATTQQPLATAGEFAYLKVVGTAKFGAYLDWGLPKDLFVPRSQQRTEMQEGRKYLVYLYLDDKTGRIAATEYYNAYLRKDVDALQPLQTVSLLVLRTSELGFPVIINHAYEGLIHQADAIKDYHTGDRLEGFIKNIREDGKIDVVPGKPGYQKVNDITGNILSLLQARGGALPYNDKSEPADIAAAFGVSKKTFKQAIGALYKQRQIEILEGGIRLIKQDL